MFKHSGYHIGFSLLLGLAFAGTLMVGPAVANKEGAPASAPHASSPAPGQACPPNWTIVPSTNPHIHNHLLAVEPLSSSDVWAVGYYYESTQGQAPDTALIMHWDGTQWSEYALPEPIVGRLNGISSVSASDIWAVGWTNESGTDTETLVLHYNGSAWSRVASPTVEGISELNDVVALTSNNVWALGSVNGTHGTLVEHWDGSAWNIVPSPPQSFSDNYILNEVAAVSANDIWAVGLIDQGSGFQKTLTEHWNGSAWSIVASPNPGGYYSRLDGVVAIAANDVWAVGSYATGIGSDPDRTLIEHWNGSAWSVVSSPSPGIFYSAFRDVTALAPDDIWAVGFANDDLQLPDYTVIEHWDGLAWSVEPSPNGPRRDNNLWGVAARGGVVWAVGKGENKYDNNLPWDTLVLREFCSQSPTATATPATATGTATRTSTSTVSSPTTMPASATASPQSTGTPLAATATVTACSITFEDVPPDSTFYSYIRCLACRGVISGYSDGTFRPGNDITRGQIAKIVSNAANIQDDPGPQLFEDVDPANTFFTWINRLANRGFMGGYPCSGEGEPCGVDNRPYFRPFANATRGQLAKIVANAAGIGGTPTGLYYMDVPEDNPFYIWIMRLTNLGVISGYPCGGEGEPCDDQNSPYFRPFNNVTRGQASKIVANTFFPNCQTPARK